MVTDNSCGAAWTNLIRPAVAVFVFASMVMAMVALPSAERALAAGKSPVTQYKLDNGMKILVIEDHRAPVVTHMVWYRVGAADEAPGKSGIAHFLEHLMFKGTDKIKPGEFSKIIARNGGQDNAFTSQDVTAYFQRVAKDRLPLVMEMEADRMSNLQLLEKDVLTERKVIEEERRSRIENKPGSIMDEQMLSALYQSHPYGIPVIGWMHEISALGLDDAIAHYKKYYAPNNAVLIVAGDVDPDQVLELAKKTYGNAKPSNLITPRVRPSEQPARAARRLRLVDQRAGNASFSRYYLTPSYGTAKPLEAEALDLLMKAVASGSTSRLYKEVVVKDKIASSAGGYYAGGGRDYGRIGLYGVPAPGKTLDELEAAIDGVLEDVVQNGITQKELDRARSAYVAEYIYGNDSQSGLARRYGFALATGQTVEDVESWPDELKKVTLEDISRVAKRYLDERRSVTGHLLPKAPATAATETKIKTGGDNAKSKS